MEIKIKKLHPDAMIPKYATEGSAGLDLSACIDCQRYIAPGDVHLIPTGIAIHLDDPGYAAMNQNFEITNGQQFMYKICNGMYWLHCSTEGCCDVEMTDVDASEYLASDDIEWTVIR